MASVVVRTVAETAACLAVVSSGATPVAGKAVVSMVAVKEVVVEGSAEVCVGEVVAKEGGESRVKGTQAMEEVEVTAPVETVLVAVVREAEACLEVVMVEEMAVMVAEEKGAAASGAVGMEEVVRLAVVIVEEVGKVAAAVAEKAVEVRVAEGVAWEVVQQVARSTQVLHQGMPEGTHR